MPTPSMPLGKEVTSIRKLCTVIADSTSKGEKELSAALKGITSGTDKANTETAKTLSDASKSIQAVAKNESKLIENTEGVFNLAKTLITRMSNAGDKLADINRQLQENSFVSGGKIDPEFLEELKKLSDDEVKNMGIEPSILKKAIEAEEERQEAEKKQKEKEEKIIDKFGRAIEGFKRGIRDAKEETTSGNLGGWGFLGAISGAVGGWNAETKWDRERAHKAKEKAEAELRAKNNKADDIVLGMDNNHLDNETTDVFLTAHGGQTLEERADKFAEKDGYTLTENENGEKVYIGKNPQSGKIEYLSLDQMKERVKADAQKRYKEGNNISETPNQSITPTTSKNAVKRETKKPIGVVDVTNIEDKDGTKTVTLDKNNLYVENNNQSITPTTSKNAVKRETKKPIGVIDVTNKIGTIDTRTGNTLSNNAMNLEKSKEKSVTIVSDNSAKVSNQNTTAFPTPISVRNSDGATKYFNDTI